MTASPDPKRLDALQTTLKARRSIYHLAHAAVSLLVALIAAGTASRLYWDYGLDQFALLGAAIIVALIMFAHGIVRWGLGRRELNREEAEFKELKSLRESLGLDDPKTLLPQ